MPDTLLSAIELATAEPATASVIWLHGLGADGNDFVPVVNELGLPRRLAVRFIFPHAPMQPVTINNGYVMRAWYDVLNPDFSFREDEAGVRRSQREIEKLITNEKNRGIAASRIVLAGFSQGGAIALQTGLRHPERLAGIMALSCYLPLAPTLAAEASAASQDVPIFMAHGTADPLIPFPLARLSREHLKQLGYPVEWHQYLMQHSVCDEEIQDIGHWLARILA
ncbi:MAG TPA: dienelactone hydrolase family protein [Burkholderiales bacterium]|nr:dienelactone hydrolase family protein [Burkholderiales bacterium]